MAFCTCSSDALVPSAYAQGCDTFFRRARNNHFMLIKCDFTDENGTEFVPTADDALDPVFWEEAAAAGVVAISPPGNIVFNTPDVTSFEIEGCGRTVTGDLTYTIDFTSYQAAPVDLYGGTPNDYGTPLDVDYWYDFFANSGLYRIVFFLAGVRGSGENECHHSMFVSSEFYNTVRNSKASPLDALPILAPGLQPGLQFGVSQPPVWVEGEESLGQWSMQVTITQGTPLGAVYMDSISTAIIPD